MIKELKKHLAVQLKDEPVIIGLKKEQIRKKFQKLNIDSKELKMQKQ